MTRPDADTLAALPAKTRTTISALRALDRPLVVALSGGSDSTALLWLAAQTGADLHAVHIHHHLRDDAHLDEAAARRHAEALGARYQRFDLDPSALQCAPEGVQAAARTARYAHLADVAKTCGGVILTAHHIEDLFETFILRLDTGCGLRAGFGPREWTIRDGASIHRPLLHWWKDELRSLLESLRLRWVEDSSNQKRDYRRNALRDPLQGLYQTLTNRDRFATSLLGVARETWALFPDDVLHAARELGAPSSEPVRIPREYFPNLEDRSASATELHEAILGMGGRPRRDSLTRAVKLLHEQRHAHLMDHRLLYTITRDFIEVEYTDDPRLRLEERRGARPLPAATQVLTPGNELEFDDAFVVFEGTLAPGARLEVRLFQEGDRLRSERSGRVVSASKRLTRDGITGAERERALVVFLRTDAAHPDETIAIALLHARHRTRKLPENPFVQGILRRITKPDFV